MEIEIDDERRQGIFKQILEVLQEILEVETENRDCNCRSSRTLKRIEELLTPKPKKILVEYKNFVMLCKCITQEKQKEQIEMSQVTVPLGPNSATVQVLDANGADITGSCAITATSSDPTQVAIGNPDPASPNVIPFTALVAGGTADITYDANNAAGDLQQTDTLVIQVTAPGSMLITYAASIPTPSPQHKTSKR